jgi:hypothetical protein
MCNKWTTPTIVEEELELVAPFLPINRHRERAAKFEQVESKAIENKRKRGAAKGSSCNGSKRAES